MLLLPTVVFGFQGTDAYEIMMGIILASGSPAANP